MIDNIEVGRTIARLRQSRGMTQQQLAAALNVSHQAVSKWENGAALPDVQTLLSLTQLFGITVEQLLKGEVPEDRLTPDAEGRSPLEETLESVGSAVNSFVNGLFAGAKQELKEDPADAEAEEESPEAPEATDAAAEPVEEAPEEGEKAPEEDSFDLENLLRMAPFMSKQAVGELLTAHKDQLNSGDIAKFAPFITRECLEKLIQNPEGEITWETLRRVAPFLKREMVDRLTRMAAKGEKLVREASDQACRNPEELGRSIGEMSQRIGVNVERALRKAAKLGGDAMNEAGKALNDMLESLKTREDRAAALRRAAMERALQDSKWDWIASHLDEVCDEDLKKAIAQKANAEGMHDWVLEHLEGYVDTSAVETAIADGSWGWLGEHVWQFEPKLQRRVALAAAREGNWLWLTSYAELLDLGDDAPQLAEAALAAGERALALTLADGMLVENRQAFANAVIAAGDEDFLEALAPKLDREYLRLLCVSRTKEHNWEGALRYAALLEPAAVEQLTELAIAEGNFEAIDRLNPYL